MLKKTKQKQTNKGTKFRKLLYPLQTKKEEELKKNRITGMVGIGVTTIDSKVFFTFFNNFSIIRNNKRKTNRSILIYQMVILIY